ncbi:MAG TPA: hypothetical protein PK490_15990 [Prosthecobacter sp.]|nr:hypothetical protein [Prosthecobacter sp.]HRK15784.1 hypothetical protein [Prosthecobacter sp.]
MSLRPCQLNQCLLRVASQGSTLIELITVMSIMLIITGVGVLSFTYFDDEDDPFAKTAQKLVQMSKYAHQSAVLQHRRMIIGFDEEGFGVLGESAGDHARQALPQDMKVFILRYGAKNWEKAEGHLWPFGEQGICEPVKIRLETRTDFRELAFHPLTGALVE